MLILTVVACLGLSSHAAANTHQNDPLQVAVIPQGDSTIKIARCNAVMDDIYYHGSYQYTRVHYEVSFENTDPRTAVAVRFGFYAIDSFKQGYAMQYGTVTGTFSQDVLIEPHRKGIIGTLQPDASAWNAKYDSEDIAGALCYVRDVKFADGTVWTADLKQEVQSDGFGKQP